MDFGIGSPGIDGEWDGALEFDQTIGPGCARWVRPGYGLGTGQGWPRVGPELAQGWPRVGPGLASVWSAAAPVTSKLLCI